ncbi:condensation domain-containing protein [Massilia sp. MB5]|uniref:condensation domain-containing protein n=1 Tax=Massilia sp. MB5 TaxID=2919578 RepID=UPI001F1043FA|nr:condensation domain-containing protein [Massilia sp. MB5]UMR31568.1 condensation domain-containing protein [Massilia sp. MB5]
MDIQENLRAIWCKVLDLDEIPAGASFTDSGGSSIQLIAMLLHVGNAYQVEIAIDDFIGEPTLARLEQCVRQQQAAATEGAPTVAAAPDADTFPLLPVHYWLFERIDVNHYNVGHLYRLTAQDQPQHLRAAIGAVLRQHDGLRILLRRDAAGQWQQHLQTPDGMASWWHEEDLQTVPDHLLAEEINRICDGYQARIRVEERAFSAVYFDLGGERGARLFVLLHHILIDNISEKILFNDIASAYRALRAGQPVRLTAAGRRVGDWARLLHDHAQGPALAHYAYWQAQNWNGYRPLPADPDPASLPVADGAIAALGFAARSLSSEATTRLIELQRLQAVDPSYVVMAALQQAFRAWSGSEILALAMVHNGRIYQTIPDANVLQTVGWMINYATLYLRNPEQLQGVALVESIVRQAKAVQDDALSLTCLKYMNQDAAVRETMARLPLYHIGFNFIPFASASTEEFIFERASEPCGEGEKWFSPEIKPFMNVLLAGQQLKLSMGFSPCMYAPATIEALLDGVVAQLETILLS